MKYPDEFSSEAEASVEQEKILANQEFDAARGAIEPSWTNSQWRVIYLIRDYITRVVLAFAKEACRLGRDRVWSVSEIDTQVHDFMKQVATEAQLEKLFFSNGRPLKDFTIINYGNYSITASELHALKASDRWKTYQKELLTVTRVQNKRATSPSPTPGALAGKLKALREEARLTQDKLAELTGIGVRSIKRHEAGGTIRGTNAKAYEVALSNALNRPINLQ